MKDTGTLGKTMRLLELVARAERPPRFSDVLARSGEPRGTVHRQLSHLVEEGLLEIGPDGTYRPGLRLLTLAAGAWASADIREIAAPILAGLHAETGETVHFGVLRGSEVIYLDKVESRQSVRMHSQIGRASPLYCTGIGKAALSLLADDQMRELVAGMEFRRHTSTTLADGDALIGEIAVIRATGLAYDREEHEEGIRCIAAPVPLPGPDGAAAISVTGPAFRIGQERLEAWAGAVRQAANRIATEAAIRLGPSR